MRRVESVFTNLQIRTRNLNTPALTLVVLATFLFTAAPAYSQYSDTFLVTYDSTAEWPIVVHHISSHGYGSIPEAPWTGEIAMEEHYLFNGETFPLPTYDGGQPAEEDEVFWTVSLELLGLPDVPDGEYFINCGFDYGRTIEIDVPTGFGFGVGAKVTVYAIEKGGPTSAETSSFGEIKKMFK